MQSQGAQSIPLTPPVPSFPLSLSGLNRNPERSAASVPYKIPVALHPGPTPSLTHPIHLTVNLYIGETDNIVKVSAKN